MPIYDRVRSNATLILSLILPLVVIAACADGSETTGPQSTSAFAEAPRANVQSQNGTAAIMNLVDAATAAWSAKDAAAYAALYSEDVEVINPVGGLISGRAAFQATHTFLFSGPFAGSAQTISVRGIEFLTGTIAIVYQDVSLTGYAFLPPNLPSQNGVVNTRVTWVVVKRAGTWQIVSQQMTPQL